MALFYSISKKQKCFFPSFTNLYYAKIKAFFILYIKQSPWIFSVSHPALHLSTPHFLCEDLSESVSICANLLQFSCDRVKTLYTFPDTRFPHDYYKLFWFLQLQEQFCCCGLQTPGSSRENYSSGNACKPAQCDCWTSISIFSSSFIS